MPVTPNPNPIFKVSRKYWYYISYPKDLSVPKKKWCFVRFGAGYQFGANKLAPCIFNWSRDSWMGDCSRINKREILYEVQYLQKSVKWYKLYNGPLNDFSQFSQCKKFLKFKGEITIWNFVRNFEFCPSFASDFDRKRTRSHCLRKFFGVVELNVYPL